MSSTDHYETAETLLQRKHVRFGPHGTLGPPEDRPPTPEEIAQEQVHATLALVNVANGLLHELSVLRQHLSGN